MAHRTGSGAGWPRAIARLLAAAVLAAAAALPVASPVMAADVTLTAEAMLGGNVRPGSWSGVRVHLENTGPAVEGELRIASSQQVGSTTYGISVQLPTGARQDHDLYAQPGFFGARFTVTLVSGETTIASQQVEVRSRDPYSTGVFIVAEHPEGLVGDVRSATHSPFSSTSTVLDIQPEDLPPRVEAWAAIDRLVWQDVDSSRLSNEQIGALQTWVSAGGRLVVVGGTTGTTTFGSFPDEMLPFRPALTVDVGPAELTALVTTVPAGTSSVPALAGVLERGTVLARSGDHVIAATTAYGQGQVTVVGIDPGATWISGTDAAEDLWRRLMPVSSGPVINPLGTPDDSGFIATLNNLPAVQLPSIDQLFLLLLGYIALIGPINYLVLRRLDRREWAWITMPVLVAVFAVAAYAFGLGLKGTDVIINELAIVRGAAGTDRGIGQVYVGIFSPARATYDVRVGGGALLSNPLSIQQQGNTEVPIDVLTGDPSRLRGYQVGFGVLRGFRAEASVPAPRIESDLKLTGSRLQGSVTNRSELALESVGVVYGGGLQMLGDLAAGETRTVDFDVAAGSAIFTPLSERMFGSQSSHDADLARTLYTRRTVIDQLTSYTGKLVGGQGSGSDSPVILAWGQGGPLEVDLGVAANTVGDTLYMLPALASVAGPVVFPDDLISESMVASDAVEAFVEGSSFSLGPGTMILEFRPVGFDGSFAVDELEVAVTQGEPRVLRGDGHEVGPLPDDQQPDQDDPLAVPGDPAAGAGGGGDGAGGGGDGAVFVPKDRGAPAGVPAAEPEPGAQDVDFLPDVQFFDREAGTWLEFEHFQAHGSYRILEPERYVDESGAFLVRFVNRLGQGQGVYFSFMVRLEGTVG